MLYDDRVEAEIAQELWDLGNSSQHLLNWESDNSEELSQLKELAKRNVAQRQEKDILDMLYAWREAKDEEANANQRRLSNSLLRGFLNSHFK